MFLLPLYLALTLFGWLELRQPILRILGLIAIGSTLLYSHVYYSSHYMQVNDEYRYHGIFTTAKDDDGRSFSRMAAYIGERIGPDEAVIHYSGTYLQSFTFFTFLHFHHDSFSEHVYSRSGIPPYCGQQYLRPGEWIRTLLDLATLPKGIWVVTLNNPDFAIYGSQAYQLAGKFIANQGDLAKELHDLGFQHLETLRDGSVFALHFRRAAVQRTPG